MCQAGERGGTGSAAGTQESVQARAPLGKRPAEGCPVTPAGPSVAGCGDQPRPAAHPVLGTAGAPSPSLKCLQRRDGQRWLPERECRRLRRKRGPRVRYALWGGGAAQGALSWAFNKEVFKRNTYSALFPARGSCDPPPIKGWVFFSFYFFTYSRHSMLYQFHVYSIAVRYLYALQNDRLNKSRTHLTPYVVITTLLAVK